MRLALLPGLDGTGCLFDQPIEARRLYIRPSHDRLVPRSCADVLARTCRHLDVVEIDGPHFILQAAPGPCAQAVASFAEALRRS